VLVVLIVVTVGFGGFLAGFQYRGEAPANQSGLVQKLLGRVAAPSSAAPDGVDLKLFWQAWNVVNDKYYGEKDTKKRLDGAIYGMVAALDDPYTLYFEPSENELFQSDLEGSFGGIGAELTMKNGLITVVAALEGTPADLAGVKGQDIILEIDGAKTDDLNFNEAILKIRGEKGTQVELTIARAGAEEPLKIKITRDTIVVKSVKTATIGDGDIAYIKINQFGQDTVSSLQAALETAVADKKKGAVIDLRNNPGGYLDGAVRAIGMVIPDKPVAVLERFKDGTENPHKAENDAVAPTLPLVVVVNGGSASASEIFAGAMRDYKRATVIGTKTFGKGSVQDLVALDNGGSVKVTIAKWFTPLGTGIDGKGIEPDQVVELPKDAPLSQTDEQITKAIQIIRSK
jgi:carboxyl-terminal processing protease